MATISQELFDSAGRPYRVIVGEDTSGNKFALLTDSDGYLKVGHNKSGIGHGVKVVTTAGSHEPLAASTDCKVVIIQAQTDNTGDIAVGASGVDATVATGNGVLLDAGEKIMLEVDNLADIFIDATVSGEGARYLYLT